MGEPRRTTPGYFSGGGRSSQVLGSIGFMSATDLGLSLPLALGLDPGVPTIQTVPIYCSGFDCWQIVFTTSNANNVAFSFWNLWPFNPVTFLPAASPISTPIYAGVGGTNIVVTFGHQGTNADPGFERGRVVISMGLSLYRTGAAMNLTDFRLWMGVR